MFMSSSWPLCASKNSSTSPGVQPMNRSSWEHAISFQLCVTGRRKVEKGTGCDSAPFKNIRKITAISAPCLSRLAESPKAVSKIVLCLSNPRATPVTGPPAQSPLTAGSTSLPGSLLRRRRLLSTLSPANRPGSTRASRCCGTTRISTSASPLKRRTFVRR